MGVLYVLTVINKVFIIDRNRWMNGFNKTMYATQQDE